MTGIEGGNSSWNETYADTLYAPIKYGDDWNKTYADTLYLRAGHGTNYSCYQESADVSNQTGTDGDCNLSYTGSYSVTGVSWYGYPPETATPAGALARITDGNKDSFGHCSSIAGEEYFLANYTKPTSAIGAEWIMIYPVCGDFNVTIPDSCMDYSNTLQLKLTSSIANAVDPYCYNGEWIQLWDNTCDSSWDQRRIYEEGIMWNINDNEGSIYLEGNITANYFIGNGSLLTGISGGNSSWNESYANGLYIDETDESDLNVNSSSWWADLTGWVSGWFYNSGGSLAFNETKLNDTIDARLDGPDNSSWNQTFANSLYAPTGYGDDWNKTYADTLYCSIDDYYSSSEVDEMFGSYPQGGDWCYQESANISDQSGGDGDCGLNYSGNYYVDPTFSTPEWGSTIWRNESVLHDGFWDDHTLPDSYGSVSLEINYTKPLGATNDSLYKVRKADTSAIMNLTIPSACWDYNNDTLVFRIWGSYSNNGGYVECYNGTWDVMYTETSPRVTEEAMWWNVESYYYKNIIANGTEVSVGSLSGTYTGGSAYVCVYNNGTLFSSESACP